MKLLSFLWRCRLLVITLAWANPAAGQPTKPPNLVVILADDLGYADVGFNGCRDIPTPHIDRIAAEGVRFTDAYVTYTVCAPSRAGLLTGRYPQRFGFERNPQYRAHDAGMGLPLTEKTLADALGGAGYACGLVGKWHLGAHPDLHPLKRGFGFFYGHLGGGHRYFPEELHIRDSQAAKDEEQSYRTWILRNHTPEKTDQYLTDEFSDEAVDFIGRHQAKPFFLFLAYNAPHAPMQATEKYLNRFGSIADKQRRTYAAMVSALDDGVGRVLGRLDELGLSENTLVFFLSDNGGPLEANGSRNGPLRGKKGGVWEGGWRVPFALRWKGRIPAGGVFGKPVSSLDIFATMAALNGIRPSAERPLDGVDLMPYVAGHKDGAPHPALYLRMFDKRAYALRKGNSKLVIPGKGEAAEFYQLDRDVGEKSNLADGHKDQVEELNQLRVAWESQLIEPVFEGLKVGKPARKK